VGGQREYARVSEGYCPGREGLTGVGCLAGVSQMVTGCGSGLLSVCTRVLLADALHCHLLVLPNALSSLLGMYAVARSLRHARLQNFHAHCMCCWCCCCWIAATRTTCNAAADATARGQVQFFRALIHTTTDSAHLLLLQSGGWDSLLCCQTLQAQHRTHSTGMGAE
jgi:hypothetical protein